MAVDAKVVAEVAHLARLQIDEKLSKSMRQK